jgi:hypothetical protein
MKKLRKSINELNVALFVNAPEPDMYEDDFITPKLGYMNDGVMRL